jgi:Histidine kinase-like ATPase domain
MYQGHQATLMHTPERDNGRLELPPPVQPPQPDSGHRRTALAAGPESIAAARDFTTATLHGWRLDVLIRDAVMVASELVTNAVRYGSRYAGNRQTAGGRAIVGPPGDSSRAVTPEEMARPQVGLAWCRQTRRLVCVVTDRSTNPPRLVPAGPDAESGRGLQIVHAISTAWGWTLLNAEEKAVWATFQLPAR